jgi:hypothetical protein
MWTADSLPENLDDYDCKLGLQDNLEDLLALLAYWMNSEVLSAIRVDRVEVMIYDLYCNLMFVIVYSYVVECVIGYMNNPNE